MVWDSPWWTAVNITLILTGLVLLLICLGELSRNLARQVKRGREELQELKAQLLEWNRRLEERLSERNKALQALSNQLNEAYLGTVTSLMEALTAKDPYITNHAQNVARYARVIAEELGLSRERVHRLAHGCELHDIGKIAIPDSILLKNSSLTEEEYNIIKNHPIWGARILEPLPFMQDVSEMVEQEHERWDGKGYPRGLRGEEIRLEARIIAVADTLDAMTSDRPYRKAATLECAAAEIRKYAGTQFDPHVVEAFLRAIESGRLVVSSENHTHNNGGKKTFTRLGGLRIPEHHSHPHAA